MAEPTHFVNIALIYTVEPLDDPGSGIAVPHVANVTIPPYDNQPDRDRFVRKAIFDHTMEAISEDFDANPFRTALLHQAARLVRLEQVVNELPANHPRRADFAQIVNVTNEQAITLWGGTPQG